MISEAVYLHYLNALIDGDKKQCTQIVFSLLDQDVPLKEFYLQLFQRSMYRIGELWERERCTIANEHVATKITEGLIELVSSKYLRAQRTGKVALITCIDKEFHDLGARMVAGFFDASGWETIFAGSNTPEKDIIDLIKNKKPNIVGISSSFYINVNRLLKLIASIKEEFPQQKIIVGGQSLAEGRASILDQFENVSYITCINGLEKFLISPSNN
jgi:MerR family transcriptional regulator, light-induced transcriptional regulator